MNILYYLVSLLFLLGVLHAESNQNRESFTPVFYGTLLELPSTNNTPGQISLQPYIYAGLSYGTYDNHWCLVDENHCGSLISQLFGYIGITKYVQLEFTLQSSSVFFKHHSATSLGDSYLGLGLQFLWDEKDAPTPNIRVTMGELFPTGKYQRLGSAFDGNNSTGFGAYGTTLGLVVDKIFYNIPHHPININTNFIYTYFTKTTVHGINSYGGGAHTHGKVHPGSTLLAAIAMEYCFTQNYLFALDIQYTHIFGASFHGFVGLNSDGSQADIDTRSKDFITLTPAIEFGFTPDLCLYLGGFFTVIGRNTSASAEGALSLIYSF